jgi:hypothetical protein
MVEGALKLFRAVCERAWCGFIEFRVVVLLDDAMAPLALVFEWAGLLVPLDILVILPIEACLRFVASD